MERRYISFQRWIGCCNNNDVTNKSTREKSVIILQRQGLQMTDDEIMAIRWHMGAWDLAFQSYEAKSNINEAGNRYPLLALIQSADKMATHILEA